MCIRDRVYCFTQEEEDQCYKELISNLNKFGITSVCDVSMMAVPGADFVRDDIYSRPVSYTHLDVYKRQLQPISSSISRRSLPVRSRQLSLPYSLSAM